MGKKKGLYEQSFPESFSVVVVLRSNPKSQ